MNVAEVAKRLWESTLIFFSRIKYRDASQWPYQRFAPQGISIKLHDLPGHQLKNEWICSEIYNYKFDLTKELDWYFSDHNHRRWPDCHYSKINYRPGNPYGDVRINWELNRLQFLPAMAQTDESLAKRNLIDWLKKNPYLHGPAYLASMEVALRWISVYWAACLFKKPIEPSLLRELTGLAFASGKFIESRLSTHSSAGNHLIVESVGIFWVGKALEDSSIGAKWIENARKILQEQIIRQINPDGSNEEQSLWYLGFVLDAVFHYYLLEDRQKIPKEMWVRVARAVDFVDEMTSPDGSFPDYGDRDDGTVFRANNQYGESPFNGLLNVGAFFYDRPVWRRDSGESKNRLAFWTGKQNSNALKYGISSQNKVQSEHPRYKTYPDGGMTFMTWGKGKLLFRHSQLGLEPTYGHGHADALSVLFFWDNVPVLIDLGSGQYNGDQMIRNFFRSTIAHNTVEIGGVNQARILGPFMWDKSYQTKMEKAENSDGFFVTASHDGYMTDYSIRHERSVSWTTAHEIDITDSFFGPGGRPMRGAFHIGACQRVLQKDGNIEADFGHFRFLFNLPPQLSAVIYHGSQNPFMGWRSTIYGDWKPIHSIVYSGVLERNDAYNISFRITEK